MTKPLYYTPYGFKAIVKGREMFFASESDFEEYINND